MILPLCTYDFSTFVTCNPRIPFRLGIAFSTPSIVSLQNNPVKTIWNNYFVAIHSTSMETISLIITLDLSFSYRNRPSCIGTCFLRRYKDIMFLLGDILRSLSLVAIEPMTTSTMILQRMINHRKYKLQKSQDRERYWNILLGEAPFVDPSCPI